MGAGRRAVLKVLQRWGQPRAGYGRTAYGALSVWPSCHYTIIDIEPALSLARAYLSEIFGPKHFSFLTPEQATPARIGAVDLAISISSLQEMTPTQVADYLSLMDAVVDGVIYLKQWKIWENPDDNVVMRFVHFPIPTHWRLLFREPAPVQTSFIQAAWHVRQQQQQGTSMILGEMDRSRPDHPQV